MKKITLELPVDADYKDMHLEDVLDTLSRYLPYFDLASYKVEDYKLEENFTEEEYYVKLSFRNRGMRLFSMQTFIDEKEKFLAIHNTIRVKPRTRNFGDIDKLVYQKNVDMEDVTVVVTIVKKDELELLPNLASEILLHDTIILEGRLFESNMKESLMNDTFAEEDVDGEIMYNRVSSPVFRIIDKDHTSRVLLAELKKEEKGLISWITYRRYFEAYKYKLHLMKNKLPLDNDNMYSAFVQGLIHNNFGTYDKYRKLSDEKKLILKRLPELSNIDSIVNFIHGLTTTYLNEMDMDEHLNTEFYDDIIKEIVKHRSRNLNTSIGINFLTFISSKVFNAIKPIVNKDADKITPEEIFLLIFKYVSIFGRVTDDELEALHKMTAIKSNQFIDSFLRDTRTYVSYDSAYNSATRHHKGDLKRLNDNKFALIQQLMIDIWGIYKTVPEETLKEIQPFIDLITKELIIIKEFTDIGTLRRSAFHDSTDESKKADEMLMRTILVGLSNNLKSKSHLTAKAIIKSSFGLSGHGILFENPIVEEFPDIEIAYVENKL